MYLEGGGGLFCKSLFLFARYIPTWIVSMSWVGCPGLKEARGPLLKLMEQAQSGFGLLQDEEKLMLCAKWSGKKFYMIQLQVALLTLLASATADCIHFSCCSPVVTASAASPGGIQSLDWTHPKLCKMPFPVFLNVGENHDCSATSVLNLLP